MINNLIKYINWRDVSEKETLSEGFKVKLIHMIIGKIKM